MDYRSYRLVRPVLLPALESARQSAARRRIRWSPGSLCNRVCNPKARVQPLAASSGRATVAALAPLGPPAGEPCPAAPQPRGGVRFRAGPLAGERSSCGATVPKLL